MYTYDIPFDRSFLQLSNCIRHVMPSTYRKLELKAKTLMAQTDSQPVTNLVSPAVSWTALYAKGLTMSGIETCYSEIHRNTMMN
jgi:hypothetical protein